MGSVTEALSMMTKSATAEPGFGVKLADGNKNSMQVRKGESGTTTDPSLNPRASATKKAREERVNRISQTPLRDRKGKTPSNMPLSESGCATICFLPVHRVSAEAQAASGEGETSEGVGITTGETGVTKEWTGTE